MEIYLKETQAVEGFACSKVVKPLQPLQFNLSCQSFHVSTQLDLSNGGGYQAENIS